MRTLMPAYLSADHGHFIIRFVKGYAGDHVRQTSSISTDAFYSHHNGVRQIRKESHFQRGLENYNIMLNFS